MQPRGHLRGEARGQREPQPHQPLPGAASAPSAAGAGLTLWQLHMHKRAETTRLGKKGPGSSQLVPPCSARRAAVLPCHRHRQRCPFPERRRPLLGTPLESSGSVSTGAINFNFQTCFWLLRLGAMALQPL